MVYFKAPLSDYNVDTFSMPIQAGSLSIFFRFKWPTTLQKIYDMEYAKLVAVFQSMPLITTKDTVNITRATDPLALIASWEQFVQEWESGASTLSLVANTQWPMAIKPYLQAYIIDNADTGLYDNIKILLEALSVYTDLLSVIDEELIWSVSTDLNGDRRITCLNTNCWLYQGFSDYRICFKSLKSRIGYNDLSDVVAYIAIGEGDI